MNPHPVTTKILQELGLHKYYNTINSVIIVQNKLYLFSHISNFQNSNFLLYKSGPSSKDLLDFITEIYPHYSTSKLPDLKPKILNNLNKINEIKQTELTRKLGDKETYKLLSTMLYISENKKMWETEESMSFKIYQEEVSEKDFVYEILDKRENIYNNKTLDLAWAVLGNLVN